MRYDEIITNSPVFVEQKLSSCRGKSLRPRRRNGTFWLEHLAAGGSGDGYRCNAQFWIWSSINPIVYSYFQGSPGCQGFWPIPIFLYFEAASFFYSWKIKDALCGVQLVQLTCVLLRWSEWFRHPLEKLHVLSIVEMKNVAAAHGSVCSVDLMIWFQIAKFLRQKHCNSGSGYKFSSYFNSLSSETGTLRCCTKGQTGPHWVHANSLPLRSDLMNFWLALVNCAGWAAGVRGTLCLTKAIFNTRFSIRASINCLETYTQ